MESPSIGAAIATAGRRCQNFVLLRRLEGWKDALSLQDSCLRRSTVVFSVGPR